MFFLLMGGFVRQQDQARYVPKPLWEPSTKPSLSGSQPSPSPASPSLSLEPIPVSVSVLCTLAEITPERIQDKSKGDALSKGFVILQTCWFILQCLARAVESLPSTELEVVTVALAAVNIFTHFCWLHKPLNVHYPIPVDEQSSGGVGSVVVESLVTGDASQPYPFYSANFPFGEHGLWMFFINTVETICSYVQVASSPLADYIRDIIDMGFGKGIRGTKRVHNGNFRLYSGETLVATAFGAIHFIAWSFEFPSCYQQTAWRVASVAMTCAPVLIVFVTAFNYWLSFSYPRLAEATFAISLSIICPLYGLGRFVLLALACTSLRSLPPGAYETVKWTTFIPHI